MSQQNQNPRFISRRSFLGKSILMGANLSAAGLLLGFKSNAYKTKETQTDFKPNVFIHIASDGFVTLVCHRSEMGQGVRSSLPVLIADELGADMKNVKIIQADGDSIYGDQNTDGSNSVRGLYDDLRMAAATARMTLVLAAAQKWKVSPISCLAENNFVKNKLNNDKIGFGELAVLASKRSIPKASEVQLRPNSELRHVGKHLPLIDGPAYVTGSAVFGADVRLPKMLIAVIARPPVVGGQVSHFNIQVDAKKALAFAGVKHVIQMPTPKPPFGFQLWGGIAVLAENTWSAIQGRDALKIQWDSGKNASFDSQKFRQELLKSVRNPGKTVRNLGDIDTALSSSKRLIDAEYYVPYLPHVSMEPPVALASYENGQCEIWAPTQHPQAARTQVAAFLGIPENKVTIHVTFLGGAFGRKSMPDFILEAAFLAKKAGVPVRVQWTREDDVQHDFYNTVSAQKLTASLDEKGKVVAWRHRSAFPPISSLFNESVEPQASDLQQGVLDLALTVPNVRAEACSAKAYVRIGWLRSVYNIFHAFAIHSFIDEIAHARGQDTRETLLELCGPARNLSLSDLGLKELENYGASLEKYPVDVTRLRRVIENVTQNAHWNKRHQNKKSLGLAAHRSFLSYVAVVASVIKNSQGNISVDEVWITLDAGTVINPDRVKAQMEGSVIFGISLAMYDSITMKDGITQQSNFDSFRVTRLSESPKKIHVEILPSEWAPGGVGEPGVPPVAPAIANAIFALTGKRIRELPLNAVPS
jgi:isoquinoline 1-oxidoreductase beta subunit